MYKTRVQIIQNLPRLGPRGPTLRNARSVKILRHDFRRGQKSPCTIEKPSLYGSFNSQVGLGLFGEKSLLNPPVG